MTVRSVQRITCLLLFVLLGNSVAFAAPRSTPFTPGETLDPGTATEPCGPTDANCFPSLLRTKDEGTLLSSNVLNLNFVGSGVTAIHSGTTTTITIPGSVGLSTLNGSASSTQVFAVGTSGTDFGISTVAGTHTFNIPNASSGARGLLTSADWNTFNAKVGTSRSVLAGAGLSGGGDFSSNRTLSIDIAGLSALSGSIDNLDEFMVQDVSTGLLRKVTRANLLSGVTGALIYQGTWNASSNSPALSDGTGTQGHYYVISDAGTQNLGSGAVTFAVGDWAVHNGTSWEKLLNSTSVASVFGRTGTISAQTGDYTAGQITFTPTSTLASTNVQSALVELNTEKLGTTLPSGQLLIGNSSNIATALAVSGDATLANDGTLAVASGAITSGKILDNTIANADIHASAAIALSKLASGSSIVTSLGTPSGTNANGGSISANTLMFSLADATNPGLLSSAHWTTFNNKFSAPTGTTAQYIRGNGTLATLDTSVVPENGALYFTTSRANNNFAVNLAGTTTTALDEGTNLYWTNARFDSRLSATTSLRNLTVGTSTVAVTAQNLAGFNKNNYLTLAAWNATTTSALDEGSNLYFTSARATNNFATNLAATTTTALDEGTNLYWTNTRFDARLSATTTLPGLRHLSGVVTLGRSGTTTAVRGALSVQQGIVIASSTPFTTTNALYNVGGTLYWNGSPVGTGSGGGYSSVTITNKATGGAIGTAVSTVDTYTNFNINQTTTLQTLALPSPTATSTTIGKIITVNNIGTANFTIGSITVPAGSYGSAFVWNGTVWNPLNAASNVVAEYGEEFASANVTPTAGQTTSSTAAPFFGFALPSAGVWEVEYIVRGTANVNNSNAQLSAGVFDNTGTIIPNSEILAGYNAVGGATNIISDQTGTGVIRITTSGNTSYTVRVWNPSGNTQATALSGSGGRSSVKYKKISGNAPVTGQSVDYVSARESNGTFTSGQALITTTISGNIPNSNGVYTLTAGKTYKLEASVYMNDGGNTTYQWRDIGNNTLIGTAGHNISVDNTFGAGSQTVAGAIYTPSVNTTVRLENTGATKGVNASSWINITQLGSTATTDFANNALGNFTADGYILGGTASSPTVSNAVNFYSIPQTTTGRTLSLNNPANTALNRIVYINNTGTANFTMYGLTVPANGSMAFIWNGTTWSGFGNQANNVAAENGENTTITDGQTNSGSSMLDVTGGSFTIPSAGTWDVFVNAAAGNNTQGDETQFQVVNSSNALVSGSSFVINAASAGFRYNGSTVFRVTTTGAETFKLQWQEQGAGISTLFNNTGNGVTKIVWQKISGYIPVTGQTVASFSSIKQAFSGSTVTNTAQGAWTTLQPSTARIDLLTSMTTNMSGISATNPVAGQTAITIQSSGKYLLHAGISFVNNSAPNLVGYQWVKNGTTVIGGSVTSNNQTGQVTYGTNAVPITVDLVAGDTLDFRIFNNSNTGTSWGGGGVSITQLGSSAFTASTNLNFNSLTNAIANGSLDNTNYTQTWSWSTADDETALTMNVNALSTGTGLLISDNTTGATASNYLVLQGGSNTGAESGTHLQLKRPDGTVIGSIAQNSATTVAFNTSSDERLKTDTGLVAKGLNALLGLVVHNFAWKDGGMVQDGFFAQELYNILPEAVTVGSDEVDAEGRLIKPWAVDYGKVTPLLAQAIKDLNFKVENGMSAVDEDDLEAWTEAGAITARIDAVKNAEGRDVTTYFTEKMGEGYRFVSDFASEKVTTLTGYFNQLFAKEATVETLCLGTKEQKTCITRDQLDQLLLDEAVEPVSEEGQDVETLQAPEENETTEEGTEEVSPSQEETPLEPSVEEAGIEQISGEVVEGQTDIDSQQEEEITQTAEVVEEVSESSDSSQETESEAGASEEVVKP